MRPGNGRVAAPRLVGVLTAALLAGIAPAAAQVGQPPVDPAIPDFLRRDLTPPRLPRAEPRAPAPAPAPTDPSAAPQAAFPVTDIRVEGAVSLPPATIAAEAAALIGRTVTLGELQELADRLSARYRALGYVLSQVIVPAQRVEGGVVTLRAVEGFFDRLALEGGSAADRVIAGRFLAQAAEQRPARLGTLERGLLLTRDVLGGTAEAVIGPSPTTFGGADLAVQLAPRRVEGFAAIDNRGSNLLGPWIARFGASALSTLGLGERFDVLFAGSPGDDALRFVQVVATVPLLGLTGFLDGALVQIAADHLEAQPLLSRAGLAGFRSETAESQVRASLILPVIRTRPENLFLRGSVILRDSEFKTRFEAFSLGTARDRLLIFEPRVTWDFADRFSGVTLLDAALRAGVGGGGMQVEAGFGRPDFLLFQGLLSRVQRFGDSPFSLQVDLAAQWARDSLPVSERFAIGGERLGRGFGPGNTTGDSGFGLRTELRWLLPTLALPEPLLGTTQLYGFLDWGAGIDATIRRDGDRWEALGSGGAGARIDLTPSVSLNPEVAAQFAGRPADTAARQRETRVTVSLVSRF